MRKRQKDLRIKLKHVYKNNVSFYRFSAKELRSVDRVVKFLNSALDD